MRDFRDAKVMAHALRDALKAKSVETTHSESLELIAKAFGLDNWNILSARIEAARPSAPPTGETPERPPTTAYCTFCGKSQHDVRTLIAGPSSTYICDECVVVCNDVIDEKDDQTVFTLMQADEGNGHQDYPTALAHLAGQSTEEVVALVERSRRGMQRYRFALQSIQQALAARDSGADDDALSGPRFDELKHTGRGELLARRQNAERGLKRYEAAMQVAVTALGRRGS